MTLHSPLDPPPHREGPHPAISLLLGFAVIVAGALIVHVLFNMVF